MDNKPQNYKIVEENYLGEKNLCRIKVEGSKWPIVAYIPDNPDTNTAIHFHFKGSDDGDLTNTAINIAEHGGNSIVLMPDVHYRADDVIKDLTVKAVEAMQKEYDIEKVKLSTDGWSGGTVGSLVSFVECAKAGVEIEGTPMIHFLDDASELSSNDVNHHLSRKYILENGGAEAIQKYRPIMISYFAENNSAEADFAKGNYEEGMKIVNEQFGQRDQMMVDYAEAGAICVRARLSNSGGHFGIKDNMHMSGVQDFNGRDSLLPKETKHMEFLDTQGEKTEYTYELLIGTDENGKGVWEEVPYEYVATKSGLIAYAYSKGFKSGESDAVVTTLLTNLDTEIGGAIQLSSLSSTDIEVKSDSEVLAAGINSISSAIKSSSLLNSNGGNISFSGDSSVPTAIPTVMQEYISAGTELFFKMGNDLNSISKIGYSIEIMDYKMADEANDVNTTL